MNDREPFNPSDPFDAMAETIRRGVMQVALNAFSTTLYRELDSVKQLECFVSGGLTGVVGACFSHISPEGRDYIMDYIRDCLPVARQVVDDIESNPNGPAHDTR